jgi:hypothetical protein
LLHVVVVGIGRLVPVDVAARDKDEFPELTAQFVSVYSGIIMVRV